LISNVTVLAPLPLTDRGRLSIKIVDDQRFCAGTLTNYDLVISNCRGLQSDRINQVTAALSITEALRARKETSLPAIIREEILRMLEAGELIPGEWVNEAELAARFSVSRAPVREACRGLEQHGLLFFVVNRGAFVRQIDLAEVAELYEIRSALFALAGRILAPLITKDGIATLNDLVNRMDLAASKGELDSYYPLNLRFHRTILELTNNKRLCSAYQNCIRELHLFRRHALVTAERMIESNNEHKAILEALQAGNGKKASRLMESHVLLAKKRILTSNAPVSSRKSSKRL
jgi:DNA-binding GntR family transcriptional regulator